ncbi:MAG: hypothetical protein R3313_00120, partial [Candidatus Saccharimonadales bacterium]|nr:hypothetical protein [Candidatus Saccharimonadales bacterium]
PPSPFPPIPASTEPDQTLADLEKKIGRVPDGPPPAPPAPSPPPSSPPLQPPPPQPETPAAPPPPPAEPAKPAEPARDEGALNVDDARAAVDQAMGNQAFDPANHPTSSLNAKTMIDQSEEGPVSTEISIDPKTGTVLPAAPPSPVAAPQPTQTLAIPGAPAAGSGMPPLASESLDDEPLIPPIS